MGLEINNAAWVSSNSYETKFPVFKSDNEKVSILDLASENDTEFYADKGDISSTGEGNSVKEKNKEAEIQKTKGDDGIKNDDKLKKVEEPEKTNETKEVSKAEVNENLVKFAQNLGMDDEEAKAWADDVMEKAQKVYDNVYDDCINKLGKTEERAKLVANIAYQFTVDTLVKQAEKNAKEQKGELV